MKTQHDYWSEDHDRIMAEMATHKANGKFWVWRPWYAWYPKRINGRWYWREYVYRYHCLGPGGGFYRYGDEFDILKDV